MYRKSPPSWSEIESGPGVIPLSSLSPDPVSENVIAVPSLELFQFGPRDAS